MKSIIIEVMATHDEDKLNLDTIIEALNENKDSFTWQTPMQLSARTKEGFPVYITVNKES